MQAENKGGEREKEKSFLVVCLFDDSFFSNFILIIGMVRFSFFDPIYYTEEVLPNSQDGEDDNANSEEGAVSFSLLYCRCCFVGFGIEDDESNLEKQLASLFLVKMSGGGYSIFVIWALVCVNGHDFSSW
jgi:hypothetical protein